MKRFRFNSISKVAIAFLILLLVFTHAEDSDGSKTNSDEVFHQDIELAGGNKKNIDIQLKPILAKFPDLSVHKNTIVVQVQNSVISKGDTPLAHLVDVTSKLVSTGLTADAIDIKDIVVQRDGTDMILHYIVYDMCNIDTNSYISLNIEAHAGKIEGFVSVLMVNLEAFSIKCVDKESEIFLPREQHAA